MDLGKKYVSRIFIYSSTFLGCYLFYLVILLLWFFELIAVDLSLMANSLAMFDIVVVLGVNLFMLFYGANVNEQYSVDSLTLVQIKQSLIYMKVHLEEILDPAYNVADGVSPNTFGFRSLPRLEIPYIKLLQKLLFELQAREKLGLDELKERIEVLCGEIDTIRERLEIDGTHRPLKLLGLTASYELMNQIYTTIATVGLAVA
jgi:hypothetical protein